MVAMAGSAGAASAAPPDLIPFVSSEGTLRPERWYVNSSVEGGAYSARFHFPAQVANIGGQFTITPGAAGGPPEAPVAAAVQVVDATPVTLGPTVRLVGKRFSENAYGWGIEGVAAYTLTPSTGGPINSALVGTCREDNAVFGEPGAPAAVPAAFAPAGSSNPNTASFASCGPNLPASAAGFSSGISTGWQDVVDLNSGNTAYFDITGAATGPGVFRAQVNPSGEIQQGGATGNDVELRPLDIPGVVATPKQVVLNAGGTGSVQLAATVKEPQVRGRRVTAASPSDGSDAAPAGTALRFLLAGAPSKGTVAINEATGQATYNSAGAPSPTRSSTSPRTPAACAARRSRCSSTRRAAPRGSGSARPTSTARSSRRRASCGSAGSAAFRVRVPKNARSATFSVNWRAGNYSLRLRRPGAKVERPCRQGPPAEQGPHVPLLPGDQPEGRRVEGDGDAAEGRPAHRHLADPGHPAAQGVMRAHPDGPPRGGAIGVTATCGRPGRMRRPPTACGLRPRIAASRSSSSHRQGSSRATSIRLLAGTERIARPPRGSCRRWPPSTAAPISPP